MKNLSLILCLTVAFFLHASTAAAQIATFSSVRFLSYLGEAHYVPGSYDIVGNTLMSTGQAAFYATPSGITDFSSLFGSYGIDDSRVHRADNVGTLLMDVRDAVTQISYNVLYTGASSPYGVAAFAIPPLSSGHSISLDAMTRLGTTFIVGIDSDALGTTLNPYIYSPDANASFRIGQIAPAFDTFVTNLPAGSSGSVVLVGVEPTGVVVGNLFVTPASGPTVSHAFSLSLTGNTVATLTPVPPFTGVATIGNSVTGQYVGTQIFNTPPYFVSSCSVWGSPSGSPSQMPVPNSLSGVSRTNCVAMNNVGLVVAGAQTTYANWVLWDPSANVTQVVGNLFSMAGFAVPSGSTVVPVQVSDVAPYRMIVRVTDSNSGDTTLWELY